MPRDEILELDKTVNLKTIAHEVSVLTSCLEGEQHLKAIKTLMQDRISQLPASALPALTPACGAYCRDVFYCDPSGRFSMMLIAWAPDAVTPVHGHNAWGCVSVVKGDITCDCYTISDSVKSPYKAKHEKTIHAGAGAVTTVGAFPAGVHSLSNTSLAPAITLHIYGMDLSKDASDINVFMDENEQHPAA